MTKFLFSRNFRKGFTLIEIMIVLSIIGILTTIVYPSYQNYLDRAHDTDVQMIAKEWITLIEQYRIDDDGEIPSQSDQEALSDEMYCIGGADPEYCPIGYMYKHLGLSSLFSNSKDGQKALSDYPRMPLYDEWWGDEVLWLYKSAPATMLGLGYIFPGMDMASTKKVAYLWWYLKGTSGLPEPPPGCSPMSGSSMGTLPDKRCAPGIAASLCADSSITATACVYFFR